MAEALGKQTPASRYSPALDLHPMIGKNVTEKDQAYLEFWKDQQS
jgi:hypothetical protein